MRKRGCLNSRGRSVVLIALLMAGCGSATGTGGDEARAIAVQFLDELRAGRYEPAWQGTSVEFKSLMGVENLRDYVKTHPALSAPAESIETRTVNRDGHAMTESLFRATPPARRGKEPIPATIKVLLTHGDEGWKVEHLSVE